VEVREGDIVHVRNPEGNVAIQGAWPGISEYTMTSRSGLQGNTFGLYSDPAPTSAIAAPNALKISPTTGTAIHVVGEIFVAVAWIL
jgi:hypothetical protein